MKGDVREEVSRESNQEQAHSAPLSDLQSVSQVALSMPEHHVRWTKVALLIGSIGYLAMALFYTLVQERSAYEEFAAAIVLTLALLLGRRWPRAAGAVGISAIWLEIAHGLIVYPVGSFNTPVVIILPVIVVAATQLVGVRAGWVVAFLSSIALSAGVLWRRLDGDAHMQHTHTLYGKALDYEGSGNAFFWSGVVIITLGLGATAGLMSSFFRTIAELMRRERDNARRVTELMESAPVGLIAVDKAGSIQLVNELVELYFKVKREEVLGRHFSSLPGWPADYQVLPEGNASSSGADAEVAARSLEFSVRRTRAGHDLDSSDWLFVIRDVSQRKAAEAHARDLAVRLEKSQRMEALGQLAGGVAHDFNNLLTAVGGTAYVLSDSPDQETRELAAELDSATERGSALTRQLLTFARREVTQEKVVDISAVTEQSRSLLARLLGERITLDLHTEAECSTRMDEGQLSQILLNLAANARDAIAGSGIVTIDVVRDEESVVLEIMDTGSGMDQATRERIFEPFFTTKGRAKGTGLGLSTVHGIVHHWGGEIQVDSTLGSGTTFKLRFPFHPALRKERSEPSASPRPVHPGGARAHVLFVEDDPHARSFGQRLLRRHYEVTVASSGEEAWLLWQDGSRPDVLVSDVIMPGISGAELAIRVRREAPEMPMLLISGYLDDVLQNWPFDTKNDLLLKPFRPAELIARIEEKLAARRRAGGKQRPG